MEFYVNPFNELVYGSQVFLCSALHKALNNPGHQTRVQKFRMPLRQGYLA